LATSDEHDFERLIGKTKAVDSSGFESRDEFAEIENVEKDDLFLLGYVSGQELADLEFSLDIIRALKDSGGTHTFTCAFSDHSQAQESAPAGFYSSFRNMKAWELAKPC